MTLVSIHLLILIVLPLPTIKYTVAPGELTLTDEPTSKSKQERKPGAALKPSSQTTRQNAIHGGNQTHIQRML